MTEQLATLVDAPYGKPPASGARADMRATPVHRPCGDARPGEALMSGQLALPAETPCRDARLGDSLPAGGSPHP